MKNIETVLGGIAPERLGFCQSHEHLCIAKGQSCIINPDLLIDDPQATLPELITFRKLGGNAAVDAQPPGCGREAGTLAFLSEYSGIHIIASTGFHKLIFYPENHWIFEYTEDQLADLFIRELTEGMFLNCDDAYPKEQGPHKAGIIKTAFDSADFTDQYQKLFSAAVKSAAVTGTAIMTHIEKGSDPISLVEFFENAGLNLNRVVFCHMDRAIPDIEIHKFLCSKGIFIEYDTIARPKYHNDRDEIKLVTEMIASGYENKILMGLDTTRARLKSYAKDAPGLEYILKKFIPLMTEYGLSRDIINKIFIDNPKMIFCSVK